MPAVYDPWTMVFQQESYKAPLQWLKRGFGWDAERESEIPWRLARKLRLPMSRWLRIGQWFGAGESCRHCGISASDGEYAFRRVGFGRAECLPGFECVENMPENIGLTREAALAR